MPFRSATKPLSSLQRKYLGCGLGLLSVVLIVLSDFLNGAAAGLAFFFVVPILLISLSLLFGHASKGKGIFGSTVLYIIAFIIISFSVLAGLSGTVQAWAGVAFGVAILFLAKNRGQQSKT